MRIERIDHVVLNVRDVDVAAQWYVRVLGMERVEFTPGGAGKNPRVALSFGRQKLNLRPVDTDPARWPTGAQPTRGSEALCFITTAEPAETVAHLRSCGVEIAEGPVGKQGALGPM